MELKQTKVNFEANSLLRVLVSPQNMLIKQIRVSFPYLLFNVKTKVSEGGDIGIHRADSLCTGENNILWQLYSN